jgi:hypothetical protein
MLLPSSPITVERIQMNVLVLILPTRADRKFMMRMPRGMVGFLSATTAGEPWNGERLEGPTVRQSRGYLMMLRSIMRYPRRKAVVAPATTAV